MKCCFDAAVMIQKVNMTERKLERKCSLEPLSRRETSASGKG